MTAKLTNTKGRLMMVVIELFVKSSIIDSRSLSSVEADPANFGLLCKSQDKTFLNNFGCNGGKKEAFSENNQSATVWKRPEFRARKDFILSSVLTTKETL